MIKNFKKIVILILIVIISGCDKKQDEVPVEDFPINYEIRNRVFEDFLFEKKDFKKLQSLQNSVDNILKSEKVKINLFDLSDTIIKNSKIKSIEQLEYIYRFGEKLNEPKSKYLINYNVEGIALLENIYDLRPDLNPDFIPAKISYDYKQDSLITGISIFNPKNKLISIIKYGYGERNNIEYKKKEETKLSDISEKYVVKSGKRRTLRRFFFPSFWLMSEDFNKRFKSDIIDKFFNISYRYDSIGKRIEKIEWFESGSIHKKEMYFYDSLGNIKEAIYYDWNFKQNKVEKNKSITFLKNKFEIIEHDIDGKVKKRIHYDFNANFDLSEIMEEDSKAALNWKIVSIYNKNNKETDLLYYSRERLDKKIISDYNEKNQLISKKIFSNDTTISYKIQYSYNDSSLISEELVLNYKDEQIYKTLFKYNEKNNMQEFIEYDNLNEPVKLTTFIYEYFD